MHRTESGPRLAWHVHGESGPPVLLVMGFGMQGAVWYPQTRDLGRDHRVATYDHQGVGGSESSGGPWTMGNFARDGLRVADAAGWESFHLVGVSMGGMIAQHLVLAAPERVRSLSLIATHAGGPGAWVPPASAFRAVLLAKVTAPRSRRALLERLLYPRSFVRGCDPEELDARMRERLDSGASGTTQRGQLAAVRGHDTRARLGEIRAPTLIVRPGIDALVPPRRSDELHRGIAGSRLVRFDGSGHGVVLQEAEALNQEIRSHVAAAEEAGAADERRAS